MARDSQKPHVCFVSQKESTYCLLAGKPCGTIGGSELQQTLIAYGLLKLGYRVTFVVQDFGQPAKVVLDNGITLVKAIRRESGPKALRFFRWIYGLFKAMDRAVADIYLQESAGSVAGVIALYCRLHRKQSVFLVASNMDLDGTWNSVYCRRDAILYWYGLKKATAVVAQTDDQMRMLQEGFGIEGVPIGNPYSPPTEAELAAERKHILWVGTLVHVKRPEMFVELAARLPQYQFVMVGGARPAEQALFDEVNRKARDVSNLRLTGFVPYDEVGAYFAQAFLLVNTSSVEGFPNTYLQAWCRGVPVVGTFDADRLIQRYGLGRKCDDVDELVSAVDELMKNDELREGMGKAAQSYAKENHSSESVAAKFDALFMRLCRGASPPESG